MIATWWIGNESYSGVEHWLQMLKITGWKTREHGVTDFSPTLTVNGTSLFGYELTWLQHSCCPFSHTQSGIRCSFLCRAHSRNRQSSTRNENTWISCRYYCTKQKAVGERPRVKQPHKAKHYSSVKQTNPALLPALKILQQSTKTSVFITINYYCYKTAVKSHNVLMLSTNDAPQTTGVGLVGNYITTDQSKWPLLIHVKVSAN